MSRTLNVVLAVLVTQVSLIGLTSPAHAERYEVVDLGLLPGIPTTEAVALNAKRQVVGLADAPVRAFFWDRGQFTDMGTLGGTLALARGINQRGEAVGTSTLAGDQVARAFVWRAGQSGDLGTLPGGVHSFGYAMNDRGQVVGTADDGSGHLHMFLWQRRTGMVDLGTLSLGGDPDSTLPEAINNRVQIVGVALNAEGFPRGFLWDRGAMIDLGTLGGSDSAASDINDAGVIVGDASTADDLHSYAVRWTQGQIEYLGTLGEWSQARAINNRGQVVGWSKATDGRAHAFLWQGGTMTSLNDLIPASGWSLIVANDINDAGDIVGMGMLNGERHAFLLTPRRPVPLTHQYVPR